jgi:hypothetical protein
MKDKEKKEMKTKKENERKWIISKILLIIVQPSLIKYII